MPKDPMELVKASKFNMVPIMIGHTKVKFMCPSAVLT